MKWIRLSLCAAMTVSAASLGGAFAQLPDCNFQFPEEEKYCEDPFDKCEPYNSAPEGEDENWVCPVTYDDSQVVVPGCDSNGFCDEYCTSGGDTLCTQNRKCKRELQGSTVTCVDDGAAGPPSNTTLYYGAECEDVCGTLW